MHTAATNPLGWVALIGCAALAGCGRDPGPRAWRPLEPDRLEPRQVLQHEQARAAQGQMATRLLQRLTSEIATNGPARAVHVCREAAPAIAAEIERAQALRIGRTSWKLRNPENRAPEWAQAALVERPEEERLVEGPADELGVLLPVHVMSTCLTCHGAPEALAPEVEAALAEAYPADEATGFAEGDLRGWFWVEVPANPN
jgi:hypothetical protein